MSSNDNNKNKVSIGPQGTQVFDLNEVNKMIAAEIANAQSDTACVPTLVGISSDINGQQFILNKDKIEVGRRPSSDLLLNESSVSAMHAQIIKTGDNWKVLNLLSSNGTFVNGEKIVEKIIQAGDRIAFAEAEFVFTYIDKPLTENKLNVKVILFVTAVILISAFAGLLYFIL